MTIDINFNVYSDANGGDPDSTSPTLRRYHQLLWSKSLPGGKSFKLDIGYGAYLHHKSEIGEFFLGSDVMTNAYKNHKYKKPWLPQIPDEANELFDTASTIGAYIIFPNRRIKGTNTINQARGCNVSIDDRFDLTLECIRRFYLSEKSPLYDTLVKYKAFFDLFVDFNGYVNFFLLDDLVDKDYNTRFYLPFDDFKSRPFSHIDDDRNIDDYRSYKKEAMRFIQSRNKRIEDHVKFK